MTDKKKAHTTASILIVEDEEALNEAYQIVLSKAGYNVLVAFNGEQALEKLSENDVDLILLDLRMPVLDGVGFLERYKPNEIESPPKIIVFSNFDMQKEIDQAYELGADKYMLKAWASPKELLQLVSDMLANND